MSALPFNIEAEQALLGALLLNNDILDRLTALEPEHFHDPLHALIFEEIRDRIASGKAATAVTMKGVFTDHPGLAKLGGIDYLVRLAGAAISIVAAPDYAREIVNTARRRDQIQIMQAATRELVTPWC